MKKISILVTGGAGYIGSHVCKALMQAGYQPVTFDNLKKGHEWAVKWGPLVQGDILDNDALNQVFKEYEFTAVIHLAGLIEVKESEEKPDLYELVNVAGSQCLLDAMIRHKVTNIVFSSTCAVYGEPEQLPLEEKHPTHPIQCYGSTKLAVEKLLEDYHDKHELKSIALRYFNAAGADADAEIGEAHEPETHLIPLILDMVSGQLPTLNIYGDDYDTDDGTCIRDYIHVSDIANAHVLALQKLQREGGADRINLGTGQGYSVKQVIEMVSQVTGVDVKSNIMPRRIGDAPALFANPTLAFDSLAWKPQHSDLQTIIETAWRWHQKKPS